MPCPLPTIVNPCPPQRVFVVGGAQYVSFLLCDSANGNQVITVFELCDGVPSGAPSFYDLNGDLYTPVGTISDCNNSSGSATFGEQYGTGTAVLPVAGNVRSIQLVVLAGTVTVTVSQGTGFVLPAGERFSWEGVNVSTLTFDGDATAGFIVAGVI